MIYLLDTNTIADLTNNIESVRRNFDVQVEAGHEMGICQPIYYEIMRGFLWKPTPSKQERFETRFYPQLTLHRLIDEDWIQAARFWAVGRGAGKQLSDTDLLLAAITSRLAAVLVSSDTDFDALSLRRESWR